MLNFVLCDDSKDTIIKLSKMFDSICIQNHLDGQIVFSTQSPNELLSFVKSNTVNVVILDIDLKNDISGLELARSIREHNKSIYIIFITGHLEFSLMAYKYKTFDYIAKPLTTERFTETILRLFNDIYEDAPKYLRLNNNKTIIPENSIKYIQKSGMKAVFTTDTRKYEIYNSFNNIERLLPKNFVRCHKSYIVNLDKIYNVDLSTNTIFFVDNDKCYIGPKYKNNFMEVFNNEFTSNNLVSINSAK